MSATEDVETAIDVEQQEQTYEDFRLDGTSLLSDTMEDPDAVELEKPKPVHLNYDVSFSVDIKKTRESKVLLEGAGGEAGPGDLLAIMGPSGAGKTTLLSVLAGQKPSFSGYVSFNGVPIYETLQGDSTNFCFVQQEDLFIPSMTPREHLIFSARLRIDRSVSDEDKFDRVDGLLNELGLTKCANTPIGGVGALVQGRISGGERKRLSLATELLSNPSVIFVDEPTSGLDSHMAEAVVAKLCRLARVGHTILATIHQPSSYVFSAFTKLHLLADGRTAYSGTTSGAIEHFASIGKPLPPLLNPADYYLKLLSVPGVSENVLDKWDERSEGGQDADGDGDDKRKLRRASTVKLMLAKKKYAASWCTQLSQLMKRTILTYRRDATLGRMRLGQSIILGLLVGVIFVSLGKSPIKPDNVQSVNGVLFFSVLNQGILGTLGVLLVFPLEKPIFLRETSANSYTTSAYFIGKSFAEFPFQVVFPFIFATILYFLVGFGGRGAGAFFTYALFIVLTAVSAVSLGYFVGTIAPNVGVALALGPLLLMPLVIFGGLFINVDDIDPWFVWLSYLSFVRYGYEGVMIVIWETEGVLGRAVLESFSWDVDHKWRNVGCLCALIAGFRVLAMIFLKFQSVRKTKTS